MIIGGDRAFFKGKAILLLGLTLWVYQRMLINYENTFNTIWLAAGGGVSGDTYRRDGGVFLDRTTFFAAGMCLPDEHADGVAAGSGPFRRSDLGLFVLSRSGPDDCAGSGAAAVTG